MLLCTKIRLQVSEADAAALEFMQGKCRGLYNWWVMRLRDGERWPGWAEAKASLQASRAHDPELGFVYGKLLHEVYFRLDKAMSAFFRRVRAAEKPGFPRVRPRHVFFTLCYPAMYVKVEGNRLTLPTGGGGKSSMAKRYPNVVAQLTEPAPANYREVAISRDARAHYYASFVSEQPDAIPRSGDVVAFDLGIKALATGVNEQGRVYTSADSEVTSGTAANLIRSGQNVIAVRSAPGGMFTLARSIVVSPNINVTNSVTVYTKPRISSLTDWLKVPW